MRQKPGAAQGTRTLNLRFPGQYFDDESGLHQNWHREYMARLGRYLTADPLGLRAGFDVYGYVEARPLNFVDLSGLLKVRISWDVKYDYGIPFAGETTPGILSIDPDYCSGTSCGKWDLQFIAYATITMNIGPGCKDATLRHELKHAPVIAAKIRALLAPLRGPEGPKYSSEAECRRAGQIALSQLRPPPADIWSKFLHYFQYIPCVS